MTDETCVTLVFFLKVTRVLSVLMMSDGLFGVFWGRRRKGATTDLGLKLAARQ